MNGTNGDIDGVQLKKTRTSESFSISEMALRSNLNGYANGVSDVGADATYEDPTRALELLKDYLARDGISIEDVR